MRVSRNVRVSMGPLGWMLAGWVLLPLIAAWWLLFALGWLTVTLCRAWAGRHGHAQAHR